MTRELPRSQSPPVRNLDGSRLLILVGDMEGRAISSRCLGKPRRKQEHAESRRLGAASLRHLGVSRSGIRL
jgi:hypothetical protein